MPTAPSPSASALRDPLARFSPAVRTAYHRFCQQGDSEALDFVVLAVIRRFRPAPDQPVSDDAPLPVTATLMADLGFDSLILAETVFFLEDLFEVTVTNDELVHVRTVADLLAFVRRKLARR